MSTAIDEKRLPASTGGLVEFAFGSYARRAPLYLVLALVSFAAGCIVELALPAAKLGSPQAAVKLAVFQYVSMFADAIVVAAVAIGVGTRVAGENASPRTIALAAATRWLPVVATTIITQFAVDLTAPISGFGAVPDAPSAALMIVTAPLTWLAWGALGIAAPMAALSTDRPATAVVSSIVRALSLSFKRTNLARLGFLALVSIVPNMLAVIFFHQLEHRIERSVFWAQIPIDALAVGPLAALQTVFALDFSRRAGDPDAPRT
ncbi:MAG: hypothetical protein NVS3B7_13260 [Candidatus Elarobacter sp.]